MTAAALKTLMNHALKNRAHANLKTNVSMMVYLPLKMIRKAVITMRAAEMSQFENVNQTTNLMSTLGIIS